MSLSLDYRAIFESHPEGVLLIAEDGSMIDINAAGLGLLEAASLEQARQRDFHQIILFLCRYSKALPLSGQTKETGC